jgi:hypothetical protein
MSISRLIASSAVVLGVHQHSGRGQRSNGAVPIRFVVRQIASGERELTLFCSIVGGVHAVTVLTSVGLSERMLLLGLGFPTRTLARKSVFSASI